MTVPIFIDGKKFDVPAGTTIAGALYMLGKRIVRQTPREQTPRSIFCGMGVCYDCVVVVDGQANIRACQTEVRADMQVVTQRGEPKFEGSS
jgi:predicted molibdopterin-dependent oxidoreductase YjgC